MSISVKVWVTVEIVDEETGIQQDCELPWALRIRNYENVEKAHLMRIALQIATMDTFGDLTSGDAQDNLEAMRDAYDIVKKEVEEHNATIAKTK